MKAPNAWLLTAGAAALAATNSHAQETLSYSYDAHGRLVTVQRSGGPSPEITTQHSLDQADNLNRRWVGSGTPPVAPGPRPPSFRIDDVAMGESPVFTFTVRRDGSINSNYSVNWATADSTATAANADYTPASGTLTFGPDDFSRTISVQSGYDTVYEPDETFFVNLSGPSGGATLSDAQGIGTIVNDDPSNLPPIGVTDYNSSPTCLENGKVMNVTSNDTDPEGNYPITLVGIVSVTGGASAIVENATSVRFFPGSPATSVVTYRIHDSLGAEGTGTLRVTVSGPACP
jgi:YD repeat-containing protein